MCESCKYTTKIKSNYSRHLVTSRHARNTSVVGSISKEYQCETCSKVYFSRVGLWRHSKTCDGTTVSFINSNTSNEEMSDKQHEIIKEQQGQIKQLLELLATAISKVNSSNTNVTITNSNNNITNNVNVFLEQRKETAVDWVEFVNSLEVPMELTMSPNEKYASVIIYNLNSLNPEEYPIYCKDKKRMKFVMMVNNEWQPGDEKNIDSAFNKIQGKHTTNLGKTYKKNKVWDVDKSDSETYIIALGKVMGGATDEEIKKNIHNSINILSDAIDIKDAMKTGVA